MVEAIKNHHEPFEASLWSSLKPQSKPKKKPSQGGESRMSKRDHIIKAHVTKNEKEQLISIAQRTHLTISELVRRLVIGVKLPDPGRYQAMKDIVKVNADLARLGNLLRLALKDEKTDSDKVNTLIDDIRRDRFRLKDIMDTLKDGRKT